MNDSQFQQSAVGGMSGGVGGFRSKRLILQVILSFMNIHKYKISEMPSIKIQRTDSGTILIEKALILVVYPP
jgi:hypothetical protein